MPTLTVRDESISGTEDQRTTLEFPTERIAVRDLIRARIYQDVDDFNRARREGRASDFRGLVRPTEDEVALNGYRMPSGREIDWKAQFERAHKAYEENRILVLVGDWQTKALDEVIEIGRDTEVTFLRLVMLVGG